MSEPITPPPQPYGPVPSRAQLLRHEMEFIGFLHFGINTFTDKEWGYGDEDPSLFNPTDFDAGQIVQAAKEGGMSGLVLTCKHHDGFCLWPSKFTEHSVRNSPWKAGRGDVVRAISDACHKQGLKFGTYLSPWDRNHSQYAQPEYVTYYRNQLRELLTNYGPVFEIWLDGANGGDGYYGGARETRRIDQYVYYDWDNTLPIIRELQGDAAIFSDAGPDLRWVGNEAGFAGDPCWQTFTPHGTDGRRAVPGGCNFEDALEGHRDGKHWMPAEVDVSIRPGWFYHQAEDDKVRTPENLLKLYYESVGRGGLFLLNLPPDRRGRIHENDVKNLREFRRILAGTFGVNLAHGARATASNVRGSDVRYAAGNVLDGKRETYWCTEDSVMNGELIMEMPAPATFNVVSLREHLPLGQRVSAWRLEAWKDGAWQEFAAGQSIGSRRLWRGQSVTADRVRLSILQAAACPAISEFALHLAPHDRV